MHAGQRQGPPNDEPSVRTEEPDLLPPRARDPHAAAAPVPPPRGDDRGLPVEPGARSHLRAGPRGPPRSSGAVRRRAPRRTRPAVGRRRCARRPRVARRSGRRGAEPRQRPDRRLRYAALKRPEREGNSAAETEREHKTRRERRGVARTGLVTGILGCQFSENWHILKAPGTQIFDLASNQKLA